MPDTFSKHSSVPSTFQPGPILLGNKSEYPLYALPRLHCFLSRMDHQAGLISNPSIIRDDLDNVKGGQNLTNAQYPDHLNVPQLFALISSGENTFELLLATLLNALPLSPPRPSREARGINHIIPP